MQKKKYLNLQKATKEKNNWYLEKFNEISIATKNIEGKIAANTYEGKKLSSESKKS